MDGLYKSDSIFDSKSISENVSSYDEKIFLEMEENHTNLENNDNEEKSIKINN